MKNIDIDKRKRAVKIASAINSIEGVSIPENAEEIFKKWSDGKLTDEQLTSMMLSICTFDKIKECYINARKEQREGLIILLRNKGYSVVNRGRAGRGSAKYTSGKSLTPAYDLSNHMWIEASKSIDSGSSEIHFLISLNPYEVDKNSGNPHHLYDRIGVQAYIGENTVENMRTDMIITKWGLPLNDNSKNDFVEFLNKICSMFKTWIKE